MSANDLDWENDLELQDALEKSVRKKSVDDLLYFTSIYCVHRSEVSTLPQVLQAHRNNIFRGKESVFLRQ